MRRRALGFVVLLLWPALAAAADKYQRVAPIAITPDGEKWAQKTLRRMGLDEKIGQLLMVRAFSGFYDARSPELLLLRDSLRRYHVGSLLLTVPSDGPVLLKSQPYEAAEFTNALQRSSKLPLLFAADFERGASMRLNSVTTFPAAMAVAATGRPEYAADFARITAVEARAIGVQWNLFPVADVNSEPANPIINTRAFGEDPAQVAPFVTSYITAARSSGMLTTAKHFPGHGDVETDSHLSVSTVHADRRHLDSVELPPFRSAIAAGVDSVMVANVTVPTLEPDPDKVASVSSSVITGLLKGDLGFKGLVVPDALDMNAVTRLYPLGQASGRASVDAILAGNDMVLIPLDLDAAFHALVAAVRSGQISRERLDQSVLKVLRAKASLGLHKGRLVDINALPDLIARPENLALAQQISDDAVTLVRDHGKLLPLRPQGTSAPRPAYGPSGAPPAGVLAVIFVDDMRTEFGRTFERDLRARMPGVEVLYADKRTASGMVPSVVAAMDRSTAVLAAVYIYPSGGNVRQVQGVLTGTIAMGDAPASLLRAMLDHGRDKTVVLALGSPYFISAFPDIQTYLCTFSSSTVSESSAVKALFGEIPIRGSLPVAIPDVARRGDGLHQFASAPAAPSEGGPSHVPSDPH